MTFGLHGILASKGKFCLKRCEIFLLKCWHLWRKSWKEACFNKCLKRSPQLKRLVSPNDYQSMPKQYVVNEHGKRTQWRGWKEEFLLFTVAIRPTGMVPKLLGHLTTALLHLIYTRNSVGNKSWMYCFHLFGKIKACDLATVAQSI